MIIISKRAASQFEFSASENGISHAIMRISIRVIEKSTDKD